MSLLAVENLGVAFRTSDGPLRAVDGVTFQLKESETLALAGETGCGKTTIALAVLNLLPENAVSRGKIMYENKNLLLLNEKDMARLRGKEISLVMQNPALALNPVLSIGNQLTEPLIVHRIAKKSEALQIAKELLSKLHFKGPANAMRAYPFEMSGGMKQRILIGISVILNPKIIIADEPTKGLDSRLRNMVLEELTLAREMSHSSMVLITHDLEAARAISDRIAIMYAGEIIEIGCTADVFENPLHPYSRGLLESLPERGFKPIEGVSPSMIRPPKGCKFHPRCSVKKEICSRQSPDFVKKNNRGVRCVLHS